MGSGARAIVSCKGCDIVRLPRAPLFLAERLVSQGGGLIFTAILARTAPAEEAAAFLAAYAFAAVFQPILSSAIQPIAARRWKAGGLRSLLRIWAVMQFCAACVIGPLIWLAEGPVEAFLLLHAALAPGLLMATPLAAADRRQPLALILITVAAIGATARIGIYLATGDLAAAALLFAFEPVIGGGALFLASRRLVPPTRLQADPHGPFLREAANMAVAMAATTLFWRSPVLIAAAFLTAEDVVALALAMQIVMGLSLPANALCQSLFGPIARGNTSAIGLGLWFALCAGLGAPVLMAAAGEAIMSFAYGPVGTNAVVYALWLSPMAGMAALWRLGHIVGGLNGCAGELALTRSAALLGQAVLLLSLCVYPSAILIAVLTPLSMSLGAIAAPMMAPGLSAEARRAMIAAKQTALQAPARRRAFRLMFT